MVPYRMSYINAIWFRLARIRRNGVCWLVWSICILEFALLCAIGCVIMEFASHDNWVSSYIEIAFALNVAITSVWFRKRFFPLRQELKTIAKERISEGKIRDKSAIKAQKLNYGMQRLILWTGKVFLPYFRFVKCLGWVVGVISVLVLLAGCPKPLEKFLPMLIYPVALNWSIYLLSIILFKIRFWFLYVRIRFDLSGVCSSFNYK